MLTYDAATLTVISGDVDGKVAEVTLFNTDVENVISVAYAQIELSEGDSDSDDDTASDIIETDPVFSCPLLPYTKLHPHLRCVLPVPALQGTLHPPPMP